MSDGRSAADEPLPRRPRIGLVLGPVIFIALLLAPAPAAMSIEAWRVAAVGLLMATWWITEAIPIPATALLPLVLLPPLGIAPIGAAAAPYANPVIFLFLGGFLIAAALQQSGLHRRSALGIVAMVGTSPARLVGGFMAATAFLSMWVSNTATVVMMLPVALSILELRDRDDGTVAAPSAATRSGQRGGDAFDVALLLGIAYAANIGGVGTLIGTPPNALLAGFMDEAYGVQIGFVQWMALGVPFVLVALPLAWLLLTRVLSPLKEVGASAGRAVVRQELRALGPLTRPEILAGGITAITATAWVVRPLLESRLPFLSDAGIAITGGLLLFLARIGWRSEDALLDWENAEQLPWGVLVLFGGGLSLAGAVQDTGLAEWIGASLSGVRTWPLVAVAMLVTAIVVFLTELTSNTATAAAFLPVVAALAIGIGADPLLLAVPTAIAASSAFMMPVATPPNAIVFGSGRLTIPQMARAGLILNVLFVFLITAAVFGLAARVLV